MPSRFSRDGAGKSAQDAVGKEIYENCARLLENRKHLLCKLEIDDPYVEVFLYALDEAEWQAWRILEGNPSVVAAMKTEASIEVRDNPKDMIYRIPIGRDVPRIRTEFCNLPEHTQLALYSWAIKDKSFSMERDMILEKILDLCQMCTTPGQLRRVWPELLGFMPSHTKNHMFKAKARSPYPSEVVMPAHMLLEAKAELRDGWAIRPEWTPEALEWMNNVIAESLILPEIEVENYPSVSKY